MDKPIRPRGDPSNGSPSAHQTKVRLAGNQVIAKVVHLGLQAGISYMIAQGGGDSQPEGHTLYPMTASFNKDPRDITAHDIIIKSTPVRGETTPNTLFRQGVRRRGASGRSGGLLLYLRSQEEDREKVLISAVMGRDSRFCMARKPLNSSPSASEWMVPQQGCLWPKYQDLYAAMSYYHQGESLYERGRQN